MTSKVRGDVHIDTSSLSDPVLIRADGQVLYTLASVVDDTEMGVTHVVRGSDHVTNTATQNWVIATQAEGAGFPQFDFSQQAVNFVAISMTPGVTGSMVHVDGGQD